MQDPHMPSAAPKVALILGAAVWANGPSPTLARRARRGADLWHAQSVTHLIACGGLGRFPPTEAAMIAHILREAGVPAGVILQEDRSTTTRENLAFALPLLAQLGSKEVILVTDLWHGPRARLVARRLGLKAHSVATPLKGTNPLRQARMALREVLGYVWHWISYWPR